MKLTRILVPLAATALLLSGCSSTTSAIVEDTSGEVCAVEGPSSKAVAVDGEFGGEITLVSKTPIEVGDKIERTVLTESTNTPFAAGETVTANYTIFNGKTGEVVTTQPDAVVPNDATQLAGAEWVYEAVRCGAEGQRTAIVTSVEDALGGADPAQAGFTDLEATDAFVIVFDFIEQAEACEATTPRDEKFPEVDLGDGTREPTISIPECMEAPTELEIIVLEDGDGQVVQEGDVVMTNYVGVDWNGAVRFDGNWSETGFRFDTNGVIEGFKQAMVGQKIGSTILVTMPSELGYQDGMTRTFVLELVTLTE